jgi:hypothetical protein
MHLRDFSAGIVVLHGMSASGKSVVTASLVEEASKRGVGVICISSGECYRQVLNKLAETPTERLSESDLETRHVIEATMLKGRFVPTLAPIQDLLREAFETYIKKTLAGEPAILILDGFLRMGEYLYKNEDLGIYEEIKVPSQAEQIAEIFARALRNVILGGEEHISKLDSSLIGEVLKRRPTDLFLVQKEGLIYEISRDVVTSAKHCVIDIPPEDAESLMRLRAIEGLTKTASRLAEIKDKVGDEVLNTVCELVDKALLIMQGRFRTENGVVTPDSEILAPTIPRPFTKDEGLVSDEALRSITQSICNACGKEYDRKNLNLKSAVDAVKKYLREKGISELYGVGEFRADDLSYEGRFSRIQEFQKATLPFIRDRLGISLQYDESGNPVGIALDGVRFRRPNLMPLENGPSRGVYLEEFRRRAKLAAEKIFSDSRLRELESPIGQRERM